MRAFCDVCASVKPDAIRRVPINGRIDTALTKAGIACRLPALHYDSFDIAFDRAPIVGRPVWAVEVIYAGRVFDPGKRTSRTIEEALRRAHADAGLVGAFWALHLADPFRNGDKFVEDLAKARGRFAFLLGREP